MASSRGRGCSPSSRWHWQPPSRRPRCGRCYCPRGRRPFPRRPRCPRRPPARASSGWSPAMGSIHFSCSLWFCTHAQSRASACHNLLPMLRQPSPLWGHYNVVTTYMSTVAGIHVNISYLNKGMRKRQEMCDIQGSVLRWFVNLEPGSNFTQPVEHF